MVTVPMQHGFRDGGKEERGPGEAEPPRGNAEPDQTPENTHATGNTLWESHRFCVVEASFPKDGGVGEFRQFRQPRRSWRLSPTSPTQAELANFGNFANSGGVGEFRQLRQLM